MAKLTFASVKNERFPDNSKVLPFGKFKGCTIRELVEERPEYILWCWNNNVEFIKVHLDLVETPLKDIIIAVESMEHEDYDYYDWTHGY